MIKENNRKIILGFASLTFALGILFRLLYGGFNNVSILYENLYYIITFVLFFITFFKQKNQKIDLLLLICLFALVRSIYNSRYLLFNWHDYFYIIAIVLVIVIMLNAIRTINQLNIIKLISITLLTLSYFRIIYLCTLSLSSIGYLIPVSYFLTLVTMVLLIIQIDPSKINIVRPAKIIYINLCFNLLLLVINYIIYNFTPRYNIFLIFDFRYFYYGQSIHLMLIFVIQGILFFYNKNIVSYIFNIFAYLFIILYTKDYVLTYSKLYIIPIIILIFGIVLNIFMIIKEIKNKKIIRN